MARPSSVNAKLNATDPSAAGLSQRLVEAGGQPDPAPCQSGLAASMVIVYTCGTAYNEAMSELPTESIRDLRAHLAEVVERADRDDQATVITRRGKPVAAVVSIEVLRKYQEWEERELNRIIDERIADRSGRIPLSKT